jgi:hypothetical protein
VAKHSCEPDNDCVDACCNLLNGEAAAAGAEELHDCETEKKLPKE